MTVLGRIPEPETDRFESEVLEEHANYNDGMERTVRAAYVLGRSTLYKYKDDLGWTHYQQTAQPWRVWDSYRADVKTKLRESGKEEFADQLLDIAISRVYNEARAATLMQARAGGFYDEGEVFRSFDRYFIESLGISHSLLYKAIEFTKRNPVVDFPARDLRVINVANGDVVQTEDVKGKHYERIPSYESGDQEEMNLPEALNNSENLREKGGTNASVVEPTQGPTKKRRRRGFLRRMWDFYWG